MRICAECFKAQDWVEHVKAYGAPGRCGCCKCESDYTVDLSDLHAVLENLLEFFEPAENGKPLWALVQNDFDIAKNERVVKFIFDWYFQNELRVESDTGYRYKAFVLQPIEEWNELKETLKYRFRFFSGNKTGPLAWKDYFEYNEEIPTGCRFYRGRLNEKENYEYHLPEELGMPPKGITPNGRANAHGIPCLYLTTKLDTTMYELRSVFGDKISVAFFETTDTLRVVDFDKKPLLFEASENDILPSVIKGYFLKKHIGENLSKPMRRYDYKDLEYVPTQFVCEFIKQSGFDGILFNSAVHPSGKNLVLFDDSKVRFVDYCVKTVGNTQMQFA